MKKRILHIIDSLSVGGAETLLVGTINELYDFDNIVVTLFPQDDLKPLLRAGEVICLGMGNKLTIPATVLKLRKIIVEQKIDIVHSHLYWSTIIARLACPKSVNFFFTVHSTLSLDAFNKSKLSKYLEKLTYRSWNQAIFVSNAAKEDYDSEIGLKGPAHILYNFISPAFFKEALKPKATGDQLKLVAVGNLKSAKNYPYLLEAIKRLRKQNIDISLDIFGEGYLRNTLQEEIARNHLPVSLKGLNRNISEVLPNYDAFVLASLHEGFGLAPLEAMAVGLPVFLSDIEVLREVAKDNAIFFNPLDPEDFVQRILDLKNGKINIEIFSVEGRKHAQEIADKVSYIKKLSKIYNS